MGAMLDTSPDKIYINITRDQTELFFLKFFFSMDLSLWSDGGIGWGKDFEIRSRLLGGAAGSHMISIIFSSNPPTPQSI